MPGREAEHWAKEARRLQEDVAFNKALDIIRQEALDALAKADADDKTTILRLQQRVQTVDEIRDTFDRYIIAAGGFDAAPVT